ncbi:MAG: ABC transporter ATP-binding protein [Blautia sp.]|nr:ABC transporter ATP-binding protein [Blautia sp.]
MHVIRKFIHYYYPYRRTFYIDLLCAAIISLVDLAYPQILRGTARTLFTRDADVILSSLPLLGAVLLLGYLLQALCKYYVSCQGHIMGAKMERDMRRELFEHYEQLSFSYYDRNNTGQMMSKLVSDLFDISEMAHHGPENFFISVVKIAGSFVFLFMIQKKLALMLFCLVILMAVVSFAQNKRMRETFRENRRRIGDINATLQDSLSGIRIVQAFSNEQIEDEKFHRGNEAFLASKKVNYQAMGTFQSINTFFQGMMYLTTLIAGGYFVAKKEMTVEDISMYVLYIGLFVSPIQILVELTEMLQKGLSGFQRFLEVVETPLEIVDLPGAREFVNPKGDIVFDDVSFHYETSSTVLDHMTFTVPAGSSVALVGPSGGGKTTICSLIPRFYDTSGGRITIGGQDIRNILLSSLRGNIGIVQQDVYLFGGTVRENIAYGKPDASFEEIVEAAKKADIHEFIETLPDGYDTYVGERGTRLSGGQKQRISIARIFLKNPPILILDEATSALDNESEAHIQKSLDLLSKGRTTITIAHRLSTIRNAQEILVIDQQGIAERGSHEELIRQGGIYARYAGVFEQDV